MIARVHASERSNVHTLRIPVVSIALLAGACAEPHTADDDASSSSDESGGDDESSTGAELEPPCVAESHAFELPHAGNWSWRVTDVLAHTDGWTVLLHQDDALRIVSIAAHGLEELGALPVPSSIGEGALFVDADGRDCVVYARGGDLKHWCVGADVESAGASGVDAGWPPLPLVDDEGVLHVSVVANETYVVLARTHEGVWSETDQELGNAAYPTDLDPATGAVCVLVGDAAIVRGAFGDVQLSGSADWCHIASDAASADLHVFSSVFDPAASHIARVDGEAPKVTMTPVEIPEGIAKHAVVVTDGRPFAITREGSQVQARPLPSGEPIVLLEDPDLATIAVTADTKRLSIASRTGETIAAEQVRISTVCLDDLAGR